MKSQNLTLEDDLEVRNLEGEFQFTTPIVRIDGDIISTHFAKFRICGRTNIAGEEVYEHIVDEGDYTALHAVLAK